MLQGLTHSSDTVITATIESIRVGRRGDANRETTDTRVKCKVKDVFLGEQKLKGEFITVVFQAADTPIYERSRNPVLLILRSEGENYRLPFFDTHGVFGIKKGIVQVAFEPAKFATVGTFYSLEDIVSRIKKYSESKVEMRAEAAENISLADEYLPVAFKFKNTGEKSVLILPPSYCFNSLIVRRKIKVVKPADENWWWSVDHWDFLTEIEPLLELKAGQERIYNYRIPLKQLNIIAAVEYSVTFYYHPYQLSKWADKAKISKEQMLQVWLGVPALTQQIVSVK